MRRTSILLAAAAALAISACEGDPVTSTPTGNTDPVILKFTVEPGQISPGGVAIISVEARDNDKAGTPEANIVTFSFTPAPANGLITVDGSATTTRPDGTHVRRAQYQHDTTKGGTTDTISVTVRDEKNGETVDRRTVTISSGT